MIINLSDIYNVVMRAEHALVDGRGLKTFTLSQRMRPDWIRGMRTETDTFPVLSKKLCV